VVLPSAQAEVVQTAVHEPVHKDVAHKLADQVNPEVVQNEQVDVAHNSVDAQIKPLP
jgi:hypothetical protein